MAFSSDCRANFWKRWRPSFFGPDLLRLSLGKIGRCGRRGVPASGGLSYNKLGWLGFGIVGYRWMVGWGLTQTVCHELSVYFQNWVKQWRNKLFTLRASEICYNIEGKSSLANELVWGTAIIGSLHLQHMDPSWRIIAVVDDPGMLSTLGQLYAYQVYDCSQTAWCIEWDSKSVNQWFCLGFLIVKKNMGDPLLGLLVWRNLHICHLSVT